MCNITVNCQNFTGNHVALNGQHSRRISMFAVFRAILTVGAQRFPEIFWDWPWLYRAGMGLSAFSFLARQGDNLCLSAQYAELDMSEKAVMSFWYGMAFAKLAAESELDVSWLGYVDRMRQDGSLTISSGSNQRPDFAGRDLNGAWHVIEAKGRHRRPALRLIAQAKRQAGNVQTIKNQPPATTLACITSLSTQGISVLMDDPEPPSEGKGEDWKIDEHKFFGNYYRPFVKYLNAFGHGQRKEHDRTYITAPLFLSDWEFIYRRRPPRDFREWRLELGLLADIYKAPENAPRAVEELPHDEKGKIGRDGIAIFGEMPEWQEWKGV